MSGYQKRFGGGAWRFPVVSMVAVKFILQFRDETVIYVNFRFHSSTPSPGNRRLKICPLWRALSLSLLLGALFYQIHLGSPEGQ